MQAAFIRDVGLPEQILIDDLPTPSPQPHQVLVRVGAVAGNGGFEGRDRLRQPAASRQHDAQVVVRLGVVQLP